jgi:predicted dehydrogenase
MSIGWGIISTGRHPDRKVVPAMKLAEDTHVVAAYSRDQGRAEAFAQKHGIPAAYSSLDDLLEDSRIDAVFISSPNYLHASHTIKAAQAGKHVLVEKPMSINMNEALEMVRICRERSVKLGVGFNLRHHPGHRKARQLIREGILGKIRFARAEFYYLATRGGADLPLTDLNLWWSEPELIGGAGTIMGAGVHAIDTLNFLTGQPIIEVAAITDGQTAGQPLDRTASIALRFGDGSIGAVFCGRGIPDTQNDGTINGTHGRISLHDTLWEARQGRLEVVSDSVNLSESYEKDLLANYKAQVEAFNRGIQRGEAFDASGIDGLKVVQITSAIIESASTGRSVRVNELSL